MRRFFLCSSAGFTLSLATGHLAVAATGGADAFGYSLVDQADGATYNYVDISTTGTLVASGDEDTGTTALGAQFSLYGQAVGSLAVSTNGFVTTVGGVTGDPTNDCALPAVPDEMPGFVRVAALHDDLVTDVYYQHFTQPQAAMVGFPGVAGGVSIIQWVGEHAPNNSGIAVDAQVVLFHDDFSMLSMVAVDDEAGAGSTMGIQNADATTGLTYGCNAAGYLVPGTTAVLYRLPDSDCCTASAEGLPACIDPVCSAHVCALDATCCSGVWNDACVLLATATSCPIFCGAPPPAVTINEIRVDQNGMDEDEYFELTGPPDTPLDELTYVVLGGAPTGEIEVATSLVGQAIPASGYFLAAEASFSLGMEDLTTTLTFDNDDTVTHLLVAGFSASVGDNLDGNADGVLDTTPWIAQLDTVVIVDDGSTELPYGPGSSCVASPTCAEVADPGSGAAHQVYRCANGLGTWNVGNNDPGGMPVTDTPGGANSCPGCGNGSLDPGEDCDDMGESVTCDADCTPAACGDMVVNNTAGETCDDGGPSMTCNDDCTLVSCGDGLVNMAAGEDCDGDGMGMAGETATCDDDCTDARCGDGTINGTAGEDCDDGNEQDGDGCAADCTLEGEPTTGGSSTGEGSTGLDDTAGSSGAGSGSMDSTRGSLGSSTSGGDEDTDSAGGVPVPLPGGCGCRSDPADPSPRWSGLALLGLLALGRRRRRAVRPTAAR